MAQIPSYTASVGLRSPGIPDTRLISPDGAALERVGASIEDAAGIFQQKQEQRENFKADNEARKLELDLSQGLIDAQQNAAVDGEGFHDGFIENVYRPRRDEFLSKIPARLRDKYATILGDDGASTTEWSMKAASKERDIGRDWVKNELGVSQDQLAVAISRDPKAYDTFYQSGIDQIDNAPFMNALEKKIAKQGWDDLAQTAYLNRLMEDDPQLVLREIKANPNKLSPATQFSILSQAIQNVETDSRPNRISSAGAAGSHQVMPGTAREIAKEMGDPNFPQRGGDSSVASDADIRSYLLRPGVSKRYGEFYLKKLQRMFPNDIEAQAIAYNAGPSRATAWLKAGRDDSVIPAVTAKYYRDVTAQMPGLTAPGAAAGRTAAAPGSVQIVYDHGGDAAPANVTYPSAEGAKKLNMTEQEKHLYQHHIDNIQDKKYVKNKDGSISTVYQTSIDIKGRTYNFPTVWDGKILKPHEAAERAIKEKGLDYWPSYKSVDEAEKRYSVMHDVMAPDVKAVRDGGDVALTFSRGSKAPIANQTVDKLNPDLVSRTTAAFASLGLKEIRVNSGFRDPADNARVGGAKKSQHMHGNAMDIDVTGYTHAQRVELIRALSSNGITGLGIGANIIHADVGGRRAWGYPDIPPWAQGVIAEHERGPTMAPRSGTDRFSTLSYEKRQQFIFKADQQLSAQLTAASRASAEEKVMVRQAMGNELARIKETGQTTPGFDETQISTTLGEDDYLTYMTKKTEAAAMFSSQQNLGTMSPQEMTIRAKDYEPDPASETFASDQKVHAALVKEIDRVTALRAKQPDKAALAFPDVRESVTKVFADLNNGTAQPKDAQEMVRLMTARQKQMGIPDKAIAPIPRELAFEVGKLLLRTIPERRASTETTKGVTINDVRAQIAIQYDAMVQLYGDQADEVISYALSVYKGLPEETADIITQAMEAIANGSKDPFKLHRNAATPKEDASWWHSFTDWFGGADKGDDISADAAAVEEQLTGDMQSPSPEKIERARRRMEGGVTPEEEKDMVADYGQAAVDAAKRKLGNAE